MKLYWLEKRGAVIHKYFNVLDFNKDDMKQLAIKLVEAQVTIAKNFSVKFYYAYEGNRKELQECGWRGWDEAFDTRKHATQQTAPTPAMFALANKQFHIVEWLEKQGATSHLFLKNNVLAARDVVDYDYDGWID